MNKLLYLVVILLFTSCDKVDEISDYVSKTKSKLIEKRDYKNAALKLSKENRELKLKLNKLMFAIQKLKSETAYLSIKNNKGRSVASLKKKVYIPMDKRKGVEDLVKFSTYKWKPSVMLAIANNSFIKKNYEKSFQYYNAFYSRFPTGASVDDLFFYRAGVSAYKIKQYKTAKFYLDKVINSYPASKYYRSSKLWIAMIYFRKKQYSIFYRYVEEFRIKYRNTPEWKILKKYYEDITKRYK